MKKLKIVIISIVVVVVILGVVSYFKFLNWPNEPTSTPPIVDANGNPIPGSIASLEKIDLNGVEQWVLIRGHNTGKPVILFLHGGPGTANIVWRELFITEELEKNFVVVLWDQRGAGKSFSKDLTEEEMRSDKFVEDTIALTKQLRARFKQDKIFLLGHSWGSALGFLTIMKHPEYPQLYHAYIAAGEAADWNRRQNISYEWTLSRARDNSNKKAVNALEKLEPFDPTDAKHLGVKNRWLSEFGGQFILDNTELVQKYEDFLIKGQGQEYSRADAKKWMQGQSLSAKTVGVEAAESGYNLFRDLPEVRIPLFFFTGRYDYQTPGSLAEEYYTFVKAPKKGFIWFEESAHSLIFEEPDRVTKELIKIAEDTLIN
jgi:pimeloyl-ACP methyl ester carboxylesterase